MDGARRYSLEPTLWYRPTPPCGMFLFNQTQFSYDHCVDLYQQPVGSGSRGTPGDIVSSPTKIFLLEPARRGMVGAKGDLSFPPMHRAQGAYPNLKPTSSDCFCTLRMLRVPRTIPRSGQEQHRKSRKPLSQLSFLAQK